MNSIWGVSFIAGRKTLHLGRDKWWLFWDGHRPDKDPEGRTGWGLVLALRIGRTFRPVPDYRKGKWSWNPPFYEPSYPNPWNQEAWFTIRIPYCVWFYFSIAYKQYGAYVGWKPILMDQDQYKTWASDEERNGRALTPSLSLRKTRNK